MQRRQINEERLFSLFSDMVNIYSPSGKEEELVRYLVEFLEGTGLSVGLLPVDESRSCLEISSPGAEAKTLFLGHIDTVPAYDTAQYQLSVEGDRCIGLGTADMKGGCAALLEAFISAAEDGALPESAMLALVVGEEENGDGTKALLEKRSFTRALVAEPTGVRPCTSHYGYMEMVLTLFGSRRHAAMSQLEYHATRSMLRLLLKLEDRIEKTEEELILNIRDLHSSESGFAVPERCSAALDLHLPPGMSGMSMAESVAEDIERFIKESSVYRYELDFPFIADGFTLDEEDPFVALIKNIYVERELGWNPDAFRSHSDANLLHEAGCTPVILGPGSLAAAHTRDEFVRWSEVSEAAELYTALLASLSLDDQPTSLRS
jgi:acetylornithine deacetylase